MIQRVGDMRGRMQADQAQNRRKAMVVEGMGRDMVLCEGMATEAAWDDEKTRTQNRVWQERHEKEPTGGRRLHEPMSRQ